MIATATPIRPVPHTKSRLDTLREYLLEEHRDEQSNFSPRSRKSFDVWLHEQRTDASTLCHAEALEMASLARA